MARVNQPPAHRSKTFIKQWRLHRGLTQEQLAGRIGIKKSGISELERGLRGYTQDLMEAIADALQTDVPSLLMRDPTDPDGIWTIWDNALPGERRAIVEHARVIRRTGTHD